MINGMGSNLNKLFMLSDAKSRSIGPENMTGEKGGGAKCELEDGIAAHAAQDLAKGGK